MFVRTRIRAFGRDEAAALAPLAAVVLAIVTGFAALAIDTGSFYFGKRRHQAATDLAAIAAAGNLTRPAQVAGATLAANGFTAADLQSTELGIYRPDPTLAPADRFTPATSGANAVRLHSRSTLPVYFAQLVGMADSVSVQSSATAIRSDLASFTIGSRLAGLDGGIANALLTSLIGSSVSLSVADYNALASAKVDLFDFGGALASRLGLTAGSYKEVASGRLRVSDVLGATLDAARTGGATTASLAALGTIARAKAGTSDTMGMAPLLDFGPLGSAALGTKPFAAAVSALDLVNGTLQVANGARQLDLNLPVSVQPLLSATLRLAIGERPVGRSAFVIGPERATAYTAQVRLLLTVKIGGSGLIPSLTLPVYADIAQGSATLASLSCTRGDVSSTLATLNVTPGLVDGWIGDIPASAFGSLTSAPVPGSATLLNVPLLASVKGRAHAQIANTASTALTFTYADIRAITKKTASTTDFTASLLASLLSDLNLDVTILGLPTLTVSALRLDMLKTITAALPALDGAINAVLVSLGVELGAADTWVDGARCGGIVLVE